MRKVLVAGIAMTAVLVATLAGYRIGAGAWPSPDAWVAALVDHGSATNAPAATERWKDPDCQHDLSPAPKKTDAGDCSPIYEDEQAAFAANTPQPAPAANGGSRNNPMGLSDTSPVPNKDERGEYSPVYESEAEDGSKLKVALETVHHSGVRTAPVEMRRLDQPVRMPGIAKPDERSLFTVTLRADGFIEKLYANETGRYVKAGEPLFRVYSPQMVAVQVNYRIANTGAGTRDERGAVQRMKNLGVPEAVLDELRRSREPIIVFDWPAPVSGVVMQKKVVEGQMVKAGDEMFRLVDPASIWVVADVPEQDLGQIQIGANARVTFRAFPGETFEGRVTFVLHELEMATRTAKVRVEIRNPDNRIKHEMVADVEITAGSGEPERLSIPLSALIDIDSGNRQVVLVDHGEGRLEPRRVKPGARDGWFVEIVEGVKAGEQVVVATNFLIDAESNLRAALSSFKAETRSEAKP
jgi:Cu(I)/Ag(I) efflux system membrane fusion protein